MTVNVAGDLLDLPGRDDLDEPTINVEGDELSQVDKVIDQRRHVRGRSKRSCSRATCRSRRRTSRSSSRRRRSRSRSCSRSSRRSTPRAVFVWKRSAAAGCSTSADYSAYVRDLRKERPVRLSRAQVETLAIIAYRQPVTRPRSTTSAASTAAPCSSSPRARPRPYPRQARRGREAHHLRHHARLPRVLRPQLAEGPAHAARVHGAHGRVAREVRRRSSARWRSAGARAGARAAARR